MHQQGCESEHKIVGSGEAPEKSAKSGETKWQNQETESRDRQKEAAGNAGNLVKSCSVCKILELRLT